MHTNSDMQTKYSNNVKQYVDFVFIYVVNFPLRLCQWSVARIRHDSFQEHRLC